MFLLGVRDAQRGIRHAQRLIYLVGEPRLVPELPGTPQVRRKLGEEIVHPVQVLLEVRRKLKQDRTELRPQLARRLEKEAERVVHVPEPRDVSDALRRLEDEREGGRCSSIPARHGLGIRHPIERVVDLDSPEALGVVLEHLRLRQLRRVERPLPFGEVVPGGADADVHTTRPRLSSRSRTPAGRTPTAHARTPSASRPRRGDADPT